MEALKYNLKPADGSSLCGQANLFPKNGQRITTQLPKNIALIRIVATLALTALISIKLCTTIFCWPVVLIGAAFIGATAYKHLLSKDPLMEAFHQIVGGEEQFIQLPQITLNYSANEKVENAIRELDWNTLTQKITRAKTLDGRNVIIVKALNAHQSKNDQISAKTILTFIEKVGPKDVPRTISNLPELVESVLHAVAIPFEGNTFGRPLSYRSWTRNLGEQGEQGGSVGIKICASISSTMANEFASQMNEK